MICDPKAPYELLPNGPWVIWIWYWSNKSCHVGFKMSTMRLIGGAFEKGNEKKNAMRVSYFNIAENAKQISSISLTIFSLLVDWPGFSTLFFSIRLCHVPTTLNEKQFSTQHCRQWSVLTSFYLIQNGFSLITVVEK